MKNDNNKFTPYRLIPLITSRIWGGSTLTKSMHLDTEDLHPGEIIACGGIEGRDTRIYGLNQPLSEFFKNNRDYFNLKHEVFPLTLNLIDTNEPLSIQVHPTEEYAQRVEHCCGLHEAWLVLDSKENAELIAGHSAKTKTALLESFQSCNYYQYLNTIKVTKGDFIDLEAGTIHAIGAGIILYEISSSSDVVYRLYDYDRLDSSGHKRELQIEKALDVISCPQLVTKSSAKLEYRANLIIKKYCDQPGKYTLFGLDIDGQARYEQESFGVYTVLSGKGTINDWTVSTGETYIFPADYGVIRLTGNMQIAMATYKET